MPTRDDLKYFQAMPLDLKVRMTEQRVREWVREFGEEGCYISFSGGKDSTVLLDIIRNRMGLKNIPFVFVNTGLEYPEIVQFAKSKMTDIDVVLRPSMNFRQVIETYGYPVISKEVAECVCGAKKYLTSINDELNRLQTDRQTDRQTDTLTAITTEKSQELANILKRDMGRKGVDGSPYRAARMVNMLTVDNKIVPEGLNINRSMYSMKKYQYLLESPFKIGEQCCDVMKKNPTKEYSKRTGRKPILGTMASESRLRMQKWLQHGCNSFDSKKQVSNPMSFWTDNDVLQYIFENNLDMASVYGEIRSVDKDGFQYYPQSGIEQELTTTGCKRTGCMFCLFGCHMEKDGEGRFEIMKKTHPKIYEYIMKPWDEGGLGYKDVIDWLNENGNTNIKY